MTEAAEALESKRGDRSPSSWLPLRASEPIGSNTSGSTNTGSETTGSVTTTAGAAGRVPAPFLAAAAAFIRPEPQAGRGGAPEPPLPPLPPLLLLCTAEDPPRGAEGRRVARFPAPANDCNNCCSDDTEPPPSRLPLPPRRSSSHPSSSPSSSSFHPCCRSQISRTSASSGRLTPASSAVLAEMLTPATAGIQ